MVVVGIVPGDDVLRRRRDLDGQHDGSERAVVRQL
jgi:hypothetical protein